MQAPIAFDVCGDDREPDPEFGLGKAEPSHVAEAGAAFPGPDDFFDPRADGTRRAMMRFQSSGGQAAMAL
ncbi:MAG: hypothetical protein WBD78_14410 [Methylocella sp.]